MTRSLQTLVVGIGICLGGCGDSDDGSGAGSSGNSGAGGDESRYSGLCATACEAKNGCGLLNPTTLEECELGCVQTLNVTLSCEPTAADIERCTTESETADCTTIATLGGPVPCNLCP